MASLDLLLQEIASSPGTPLRVDPGRPSVWPSGTPAPTTPTAPPKPPLYTLHSPHAQQDVWGWYDSEPGQLAGLEVTEHQISPALCRAVFQTKRSPR